MATTISDNPSIGRTPDAAAEADALLPIAERLDWNSHFYSIQQHKLATCLPRRSFDPMETDDVLPSAYAACHPWSLQRGQQWPSSGTTSSHGGQTICLQIFCMQLFLRFISNWIAWSCELGIKRGWFHDTISTQFIGFSCNLRTPPLNSPANRLSSRDTTAVGAGSFLPLLPDRIDWRLVWADCRRWQHVRAHWAASSLDHQWTALAVELLVDWTFLSVARSFALVRAGARSAFVGSPWRSRHVGSSTLVGANGRVSPRRFDWGIVGAS